MRKILVVISIFTILSIVGLATTQTAHAQTQQECESFVYTDPLFGLFNTDANDLEAQTFVASGSYSVGAVKLNLYEITLGLSSDINVYITETSGVAPNAGPDMNFILATEIVSSDLLPILDQVVITNNNFSCDPLVDAGQYIVFDPPVPITSGNQYALVIEWDAGDASNFGFPYELPVQNYYAGGNHWECNVPTACSRNTPGTWDLSGGVHDMGGFAVFDNFIIVTPQGTADTWLENFLSDFLGLNSTTGKLIFGLGFILVLMLAMLLLRVHVLPTMAFGGFATAAAALGSLVPVELFLAMFALLGAAMLIGATMFRSQGDE